MGVVLYEMAALRLPFHAASIGALAQLVLRSEPSPLPAQYSAELRALLAKMLLKVWRGERAPGVAVAREPV